VKVKRRTQEVRNLGTAKLVQEQLAKLRTPRGTVLATVSSSKKGRKPYDITLGSNNAVYCNCNGFKFRNACRHMERFRTEHVRQELK
jgi:hypothetical protein